MIRSRQIPYTFPGVTSAERVQIHPSPSVWANVLRSKQRLKFGVHIVSLIKPNYSLPPVDVEQN
jgi:hypothetical protein